MASPLQIYNGWQSRQQAQNFELLGEVVDLEGFRDTCIGLSDWTTGYEAAFQLGFVHFGERTRIAAPLE